MKEMIINKTLEEISDGNIYLENDMVKADTSNCIGCKSLCCRNMGDSIILDPFDMQRLMHRLDVTFEVLLKDKIEINVVEGLMLPNLKMQKDSNACAFLSKESRCTIHANRPGVCRLFPLARYWENDDSFSYILQKDECHKKNLSSIQVKKWINSEYGEKYDEFIILWHQYRKNVGRAVNSIQQSEIATELKERQIKTICMFTLKTFFMEKSESEEEFLNSFKKRVDNAYTMMGMR